MKIVMLILLLTLLFLQYELWFAKSGVANTLSLHQSVNAMLKQNEDLKKHNEILKADIANLKQAGGAIEEHARNDLGMIKKGEVFYQIVDASADNKVANSEYSNDQDGTKKLHKKHSKK